MPNDSPSAPPLALDLTSAASVIAAFGGLRPMAKALGVAASTVQGWKERGHIPESHHAAIQAAYAQMRAAPPPEPAVKALRRPDPKVWASYERPLLFGGLLGLGGLSLASFVLLWQGPTPATTADLAAALQGLPTYESQFETLQNDLEAQTQAAASAVAEQTAGLDQLRADLLDTVANLDLPTGFLTAADLSDFESLVADLGDAVDGLVRAQNAQFEALAHILESQPIPEVDTTAFAQQIATLQADLAAARAALVASNRAAPAPPVEQAQVAPRADTAAVARPSAEPPLPSALLDLIEIRLRLAAHQVRAQDSVQVAALAQGDAGLDGLAETLGQLDEQLLPSGQVPGLLALAAELDRLVAVDQAAIRAQGFGFGRIPPVTDLASNQGKLAQARASLHGGDYDAALTWLQQLAGEAAAQSADAQAGVQAWQLLTQAQRQLDDWLSQNLQIK